MPFFLVDRCPRYVPGVIARRYAGAHGGDDLRVVPVPLDADGVADDGGPAAGAWLHFVALS